MTDQAPLSRGVLKEGESAKDLTKEEWRKRLTPMQYAVMREAETERPFSGEYNKHFEKGSYLCASCGSELFTSDSKFATSCGWPAFSAAKDEQSVKKRSDTTFNMLRTEVLCSNCNAHLGHLFDDGPTASKQRYCINSVCLSFKKEAQ